MDTAHLYFAAMVLTMLPLTVVHLICWQVVNLHPVVMPDDNQRAWFKWSEVAMASTCLAMLWYMWMLLPWMVSICATDPFVGALAHGPWIALTACVLWAKLNHLRRLVQQVNYV